MLRQQQIGVSYNGGQSLCSIILDSALFWGRGQQHIARSQIFMFQRAKNDVKDGGSLFFLDYHEIEKKQKTHLKG